MSTGCQCYLCNKYSGYDPNDIGGCKCKPWKRPDLDRCWHSDIWNDLNMPCCCLKERHLCNKNLPACFCPKCTSRPHFPSCMCIICCKQTLTFPMCIHKSCKFEITDLKHFEMAGLERSIHNIGMLPGESSTREKAQSNAIDILGAKEKFSGIFSQKNEVFSELGFPSSIWSENVSWVSPYPKEDNIKEKMDMKRHSQWKKEVGSAKKQCHCFLCDPEGPILWGKTYSEFLRPTMQCQNKLEWSLQYQPCCCRQKNHFCHKKSMYCPCPRCSNHERCACILCGGPPTNFALCIHSKNCDDFFSKEKIPDSLSEDGSIFKIEMP